MTITEFLEARVSEDEFDASRELLWGTTPTLSRMNARVLAECAAKRALVAMHEGCDDVSYGDASTCPEIRTLAAVYADHPDYRQEWRRG